jgi:hypothetical protein
MDSGGQISQLSGYRYKQLNQIQPQGDVPRVAREEAQHQYLQSMVSV